MILHHTATRLGLGRAYADIFWKVVAPKVSEFKPVHDRTQSLFIHVPKTAGVSFHRAMYDGDIDYGHAPAIAFRYRDPERFARYWKFAFMRDPVDRFISAFYYLTTNPHNPRDTAYGQAHMAKYGTVANLVDAMADPWVRAKVMSWPHFLPQAWFLTDFAGRPIVDFIGRTEYFDETLPYIADKLGMDYRASRENVSRRSREGELNAQQRAFVGALYRQDSELLASAAQTPADFAR